MYKENSHSVRYKEKYGTVAKLKLVRKKHN